MPQNNLGDELFNRELQTMSIFLWGKSMRTAITLEEYIQTRLLQGVDREIIRAELLDDLNNNIIPVFTLHNIKASYNRKFYCIPVLFCKFWRVPRKIIKNASKKLGPKQCKY